MLAKKLLLLGGLAVVLGTAGCAATCRTNPHDCLRSVEEVARVTGCTTGECHGERCRPVILAMLKEAGPG